MKRILRFYVSNKSYLHQNQEKPFSNETGFSITDLQNAIKFERQSLLSLVYFNFTSLGNKGCKTGDLRDL